MSIPDDKAESGIFTSDWSQYNRPAGIVTLGHYYSRESAGTAGKLLRETRGAYTTAPLQPGRMRQNLGWTALIDALNNERKWSLKRLFALLDPMLAPDIAIAVVPTHIAYQAFWPLRTLARNLAEQGRMDATSCLVRSQSIRRITFGGPSTRALHRQTIQLVNAPLVAGRPVLLLDDITKSGASLTTCREMLYEAGAAVVQAIALGRVIVGEVEGA